eukprot:13762829-Alexandrium_andersonii.AAC.1
MAGMVRASPSGRTPMDNKGPYGSLALSRLSSTSPLARAALLAALGPMTSVSVTLTLMLLQCGCAPFASCRGMKAA